MIRTYGAHERISVKELDGLHLRRDQPLGRRRLTRLLVRVAALVPVAPFG